MQKNLMTIGARMCAAFFLLCFSCAHMPAFAQSGATQTTSTQTASQAPTPASQDGGERRVPLTEPSVAGDTQGGLALAGRLRSTTTASALNGSLDAPIKNVRLVIENRSPNFFTYVSGFATFYDAEGVRCGEGLFRVDALAVNESAETDAPGLRLTCAPAAWRITATNLLTRTGDAAKPVDPTAPTTAAPSNVQSDPARNTSPPTPARFTTPPLVIDINGKTLPVQLGNPLDVKIGKERLRIVVSAAP